MSKFKWLMVISPYLGGVKSNLPTIVTQTATWDGARTLKKIGQPTYQLVSQISSINIPRRIPCSLISSASEKKIAKPKRKVALKKPAPCGLKKLAMKTPVTSWKLTKALPCDVLQSFWKGCHPKWHNNAIGPPTL